MNFASECDEGVRIAVVVTPNARRSEVVALEEDALRVKLAAAPVDGKANKELIKLLAAEIGVAKSAVGILQGQNDRRKVLIVRRTTLAQITEAFTYIGSQ